MFAGTLGRSQFFVRSCIVGIAETVVLLICIALQYQAFLGPPGQARYQLAATVFLVSGFFCFQRIGFAIRRNRDAGGGDLLPGLYAIGLCAALVLQVQALVVRTDDSPLNGLAYAGLLYLALTGVWLYLLFEAPGVARVDSAPSPSRGRFAEADTPPAPSQLSLAMEQAIAGERPIPAAPMPNQPQGFLGSVRRPPPPPPPQRTQFGRRGVK